MNDESDDTSIFEPAAWDDNYSGDGQIWSGEPNVQLVAEVADLAPGTALDVGCGEGGDVIWLARQGWTVTGLDLSDIKPFDTFKAADPDETLRIDSEEALRSLVDKAFVTTT